MQALGCSVIAASTLSVYYCNGCELFFPKYLGSAALLMFVAIAVVLYQVAIIVVRFLNLNCVNAFSKVAFVIVSNGMAFLASDLVHTIPDLAVMFQCSLTDTLDQACWYSGTRDGPFSEAKHVLALYCLKCPFLKLH